MTILEVRRHSTRKHTGGSQLSQEGVDLARRVGASMGPYDLVVSSVVPRARETALAMGFAVDHEECALVAALPHADHGAWGAMFGHCEGRG